MLTGQKQVKSFLYSCERAENAVVKKLENENTFEITGAKICGFASRNGYEYAANALENAVKEGLYENVSLYDMHPTTSERYDRSAERGQLRYIGFVKNARFEAGKGVYGDIVGTLENEAGKTFFWRAEKDPSNIGLSHEVLHSVPVEGDEGRRIIETIYAVNGMAATAKPATNANLFESIQEAKQEMELTKAQLLALTPEQIKQSAAWPAIEASHKETLSANESLTKENEELKSKIAKIAHESAIAKCKTDLGATDNEINYLRKNGASFESFESAKKAIEELREVAPRAATVRREAAESFESVASDEEVDALFEDA